MHFIGKIDKLTNKNQLVNTYQLILVPYYDIDEKISSKETKLLCFQEGDTYAEVMAL